MSKIVLMFISAFTLISQDSNMGKMLKLNSSFAPFPDKKRIDGHTYSNKHFPFTEHYNDSSILVYIPKNFDPDKKVTFIVYYHGWYNSNTKANEEFKIASQFYKSALNAILLLPEGPKNAPDSYGGKHENTNVFKDFINDIVHQLKDKSILVPSVDNIILAGHSGAYRVISMILNRGGLTNKISKVILFDGLYGQIEKFSYWIQNYKGKFFNIITPDGGTYNESEEFLKNLDDWSIKYQRFNKNKLIKVDYINHRIIFQFTTLEHNDVINPYFNLILTNFK